MIPQKSNSGLYVQGLYEIQILDSFGVKTLGVHDCGAIYERWINNKGVGGSIPLKMQAVVPANGSHSMFGSVPRGSTQAARKPKTHGFYASNITVSSFTRTLPRKAPRERAWNSPKPAPIR